MSHIHHDLRAQARRELNAMRRLAKPARQLHITDFCAIVGAVGLAAFVATFALTGGF